MSSAPTVGVGEQGRWSCLPAFLDAPMCDHLVELCERFEQRPADVVRGHAANRVRVCGVRRIPRSPGTTEVYDLAWELGSALNDSNFQLDLSGISKQPEYVTYEAATGRFDWHNDLGLERPNSVRKLTLTIQLSSDSDYSGGDFEVFDTPDPMPRERGSVLALPSYVHHRVTPVTRGTRRALLVWLAGPALR